jgi:hypothetical protein
MFSLLTRGRSVHRTPSTNRLRGTRRSTVRLSLERLEERDCPSSTPLITAFSAAITGHGRQVELTGEVDNVNGPVPVTFVGVVNDTITTFSNGCFDVFETAISAGIVSATADLLGSNTMIADIAPATPIVTLSTVSYGSQVNRTITVFGSVSAPFPATTTVTLGGVLSGTVIPNLDGTFQYTGNATGIGNVTAKATDIWSQTSDPATLYIAGVSPVISNLSVTRTSQGQWVISGTVTDNLGDNNAAGLAVSLGGCGLSGATATVNANGTFTVIMNSMPAGSGIVTAVVNSNGWGFGSGTVACAYSNT